MSKMFMIQGNDISDGYHTFDELYDHRCLLFIRLCLTMPDRAAWRPDYEGWFCLYLELPEGQISYHCPVKYEGLINTKIKRDLEYKWDGHAGAQVLERLQGKA